MENTPATSFSIDYESLFKALPGSFIVLSPDLHIIEASDFYFDATHTAGIKINGQHLFDIFEENEVVERLGSKNKLLTSLQHVLEHKTTDALKALRFDIRKSDGQFEERYWDVCSKPILSRDSGEVQFILHEVREVTEQVKLEREASEAQADYQEINERFERIARATSDVIWDWNLATDKIWWNEGFTSLFGFAAADIEPDSSSWSSRIHPDDLSRINDSIHHAIEQGHESWEGTYKFRCADGSYKTVFDQGYIILNEEGKSVRMLGAMQDVTEKEKIEKKLKEQTDYILNTLDSLPLMIWNATPDGAVNYYNQQWYNFTGADFEQMKNWGWREFIHPDDFPNTQKVWLQALSDIKPLTLEHRIKAKDGTYHWFLVSAVPIKDADGNVMRWVGSNTDIQSQKQMLADIEESKERFKMLAESIPHVVWSANPDGNVDYFNQQWYDYTKMSEEATLGLGWAPVLHPDDHQPTMDDWMRSMRTGEKYERELRLRDINTEEEYRWFLARALPLKNAEGEILTWFGTATDIHEQKVLREEVEASEKKFRFLTESIPQMVWSANPDGFIDYTNHRWFDYTKMDESSLGFGWAPAIHPDEVDNLMSTWMHCVGTGENLEFQVRFQDMQAKTYRWFLLRAVPMRNEEGEIVKWFGTATDIHDQKLLQDQLQESEYSFRFLTESIPQMVWTASPDGTTDYFNQRWITYTGLSLEESIGEDAWLKAIHPDDLEMAAQRWLYSVQSGDYYEIEYRIKDGYQGTYRWFLGQAIPMRDTQNNIVKWFGTCTDIEDHKRAEEELIEKNLELERTNQDLDSFVYTASHDLKLPVVNITGIVEELMRVVTFNDPEAPLMIDMLNKSIRQLQNTIEELSDVVQVQKTKRRDLEHISVAETVQAVEVTLQSLIQTSGAIITSDFSEAPEVYFTRAGFKSILYNLLSNSIKYKAQGRLPLIHLSTKIKDNFVEFSITDNGMGLDMGRHKKKLFQMFRRFHNHVSGSGLGLYIVNRLLTNYGGSIEIESKLNEGTTFYLYFKKSK